MAREPDAQLAAKVLPGPLYRALTHIFDQGISECMLVGGTALAGYYAGHRRSDDLDLFVRDAPAHRATVLAVRSLSDAGATIDEQQATHQFYSCACQLKGHDFTVQVVLDAHLFNAGSATRAVDGVWVADLATLFKQKSATLVSRCSEKDLYDLHWLFDRFPARGVQQLVDLGTEIDSGMSAEAALMSLIRAPLSQNACNFAPPKTSKEVFETITSLRDELATALDKLARGQPVPSIGALIRTLRK